ncbi:MAG: efflux RND transporter periplasmic adaptor subunit [Chryseolinea sp.]
MNKMLVFGVIFLSVLSCKKKEHKVEPSTPLPVVDASGGKITFPNDAKSLSFFEMDTVKDENLAALYQAPASVAVTITSPVISGGRNTVLFDNPDLGSTYSAFLQHLINIRTHKLNLDRIQDLSQHGAATGKEVLDAETQLANEEAAITEQEAKLKIAGLDPEVLKNPSKQEAWLLCEVPESQIQNMKIGTNCGITFTAYPNDVLPAHISGLGAEVDNITRLVKVRVVLANPSNKFQVGMFASVEFNIKEGKVLSIPISAVVNVQGKDYAFIRTSNTTFERREMLLGQQLDKKVVVLHGLSSGEIVAVKGAMELKGLSFGY